MPSKGKVLVIDDNPDAVEVLKRALVDEEYEVLTSLSGEEGLSMALSEHPSCVLLDIMMPGMSGFHICKTIKQEMGLSLPIVVLSAKSNQKDISYAKSMGADDYLTKPVSSRRLIATVDAAVKTRAHQGTMAGTTLDTVLVASNNVKTVYQLRQTVEGMSAKGVKRHKVLQAQSAAETERLVKSQTIDLIIADCHVPKDGASTLCRKIKTNPKSKQIPIIVLMEKHDDDIKYAWANERLRHPVSSKNLVKVLKQHLNIE